MPTNVAISASIHVILHWPHAEGGGGLMAHDREGEGGCLRRSYK